MTQPVKPGSHPSPVAGGMWIEPPPQQTPGKPLYRVVYRIDVPAADEREAAEYVQRILSDPEAQAPVLDIIDHAGVVTVVDLSAAEGQVQSSAFASCACSVHPALQEIQDVLYLEGRDGRDWYNPDKPWSPDTLDQIGRIVGRYVGCPVKKEEESGAHRVQGGWPLAFPKGGPARGDVERGVPQVMVQVRGGIADVLCKPRHISVTIIDYDVEGEDADRLDHDAQGQLCCLQHFGPDTPIGQ